MYDRKKTADETESSWFIKSFSMVVLTLTQPLCKKPAHSKISR